jgi:putative Ca2+/H+ antiporter (TMEM165/GDT1 family)
MEAVLPAMLAVLFAETGSKTQTLTHSAAVAQGSALPVMIALALTSLMMLGIGAIGGMTVAHVLNPDAGKLLAGLALIFAGVPMLVPRKPKPVTPSTRYLPGQLVVSQFGDASQFIVFALAARTEAPVLTLAGGLFGVAAAMVPPILMSSDWPGRVPVLALRMVAGLVLTAAGGWLAVSALRLI